VRINPDSEKYSSLNERLSLSFFQSWNMLTRTSTSFVFVNMKLTVIWIIGFFVRYFVLLPGRAVILIVGVSWKASRIDV
jgi:glycerol-3-phosphate O-acyltransferase 3/4